MIQVSYGEHPADSFRPPLGLATENVLAILRPPAVLSWIPPNSDMEVLHVGFTPTGDATSVFDSELYFWLGRDAETL